MKVESAADSINVSMNLIISVKFTLTINAIANLKVFELVVSMATKEIKNRIK